MSKAFLVMDMPKNCAECDLCVTQDDEYFCIPDDFAHYLGSSYVNHSCENKPDWCPLRPVPEKDNKSYFSDEYSDGHKDGYNACIDEILRKKEQGK